MYFFRRDREPYDDRPAREDPRREGRDKERDPRDKKPVRDREIYRERDCDDDKKGNICLFFYLNTKHL